MAGQRDYYADLGMPRDADVEAIKKQYRKLGKWETVSLQKDMCLSKNILTEWLSIEIPPG
jgi:hypothetical protein